MKKLLVGLALVLLVWLGWRTVGGERDPGTRPSAAAEVARLQAPPDSEPQAAPSVVEVVRAPLDGVPTGPVEPAAPALSALSVHARWGRDGSDAAGVGLALCLAEAPLLELNARFAEILEPHMPVERCEMLCEAVQRAIAAAKPGEVVLFSPACASFDQFRDYETRGDSFRSLVAGLTGGSDEQREGFTARSAA